MSPAPKTHAASLPVHRARVSLENPSSPSHTYKGMWGMVMMVKQGVPGHTVDLSCYHRYPPLHLCGRDIKLTYEAFKAEEGRCQWEVQTADTSMEHLPLLVECPRPTRPQGVAVPPEWQAWMLRRNKMPGEACEVSGAPSTCCLSRCPSSGRTPLGNFS